MANISNEVIFKYMEKSNDWIVDEVLMTPKIRHMLVIKRRIKVKEDLPKNMRLVEIYPFDNYFLSHVFVETTIKKSNSDGYRLHYTSMSDSDDNTNLEDLFRSYPTHQPMDLIRSYKQPIRRNINEKPNK